MRFIFAHSHAFSRGRLRIEDDGANAGTGVMEFGDGVTLLAEWRRDGEDILLEVPSYETARKTVIEPKRWRLIKSADGAWRTHRVE